MIRFSQACRFKPKGREGTWAVWLQNVTFSIRSLIRNDQVYTGLQIQAGGREEGVYISSRGKSIHLKVMYTFLKEIYRFLQDIYRLR